MVEIPEKYRGIPINKWTAECLIEEENAEFRRLVIQVIGYEKICRELKAIELDTWREYTLLKIDKKVDIEPIHLLKMTFSSTKYIHILRVPPNITNARVAAK